MSACAPVRGPADAWGRMRLWEKFSPPMQTLQRRSCQTRTRLRKKGCVYGAGVSGATIFAYVGGNPLGLADPKGLVTWSGSVTGGGVIDGIGGAGFIFDLTSECKCGKKVRIKGYASTVAGGLGVKYSGNSASANFFDPFDCPDGTRANGSFAAFSITSVVGGGFSWGAMRIGYLRSGWPSLTDSVVGFDISAGIYIGASVVTEMQIIPCESCEGK